MSVSVITYNHGQYIEKCLKSILNQKTRFSFEVIIGEDGSEDSTREKCISIANKHKDHVRLFLRSRADVIYIDGSPTGRFNTIENLKAAKGKYIALCEGDDYWTDEFKLQKQVDFLESNIEFNMCFHQTEVIENDSKIRFFNRWESNLEFDLDYVLENQNFIATASCLFRNNIKIPNWFYTVHAGDKVLHILNAEKGKIYYFSDSMAAYRIHQGGVWSQLSTIEMMEKGIKTLEIINEGFNYKYDEKIKKRISDRQRVIDRILYESRFSTRLKNKLNSIWENVKWN